MPQPTTPDALRPADFYRAKGYLANESVGYMMRGVMSSCVQMVDIKLAPHGLTNAQWGPLFMLRNGKRSTVAEMARQCIVDPGAMTRMLDRLEAKGLCRRARCTEDRRVVNVELTPEGEAAAAFVPQALCEVWNAHLAGFTRDEWQTLKTYLRRMLDNAEALRDNA